MWPWAPLLALGATVPSAAWAQTPQLPAEHMSEDLDTVGDLPGRELAATTAKTSKPDLVIVPIPQSSPALGSGATLAAAMFYNPNQSKDPWITAVGLMKTSNGSQAAGVLHKMAFDQDRFRLGLFAGYANVNIRFYGVGAIAGNRDISVELNERGLAGMIQGQIRMVDNFYVGARVMHLDLKTMINKENEAFPDSELPTREFRSKLTKLGPVITFDRRDNSINPRSGEVANIAWLFGVEGLGSDFSHHKLTIDANIYRAISKNTVVAGRAAACAVSSGAPFYDLCFYGTSSDLRGYEAGRYRDRASWAAQVELRQHLFGRFGAVAFAGIGGSAPKWSEIDSGKFLPAAGFGARFQPSKGTPINVRIDYAWGRESQALYIGIGEAF